MLYNPSKSIWKNPNIEYVFNDEIIEYDIRDAGFSLIKQHKLLPESEIMKLEIMGKGDARHIAIGKLQGANRQLAAGLNEKFTEIRSIFINSNNLTDDRIISVKKDAIYTIGACSRLKFGMIEFVPKNVYSSYIRFPTIQNMELYYSDTTLDVKGMSDSSVNKHRLYMISFLNKIISMIEDNNNQAKRFIVKFIDEYKHHELDDEYYIEFNNMSKEWNPTFNYMNVIVPIVQIILREVQ